MEFQNEIFSKVLSKEEYKASFEEIIQVLRNHRCKEVDILFGVAWGNEYKDWTPFSVPIDNITQEIALAEQLEVGQFGNDDFYLMLNALQTEILFCHELDIHLRYNQENTIIQEILQYWETKGLIHERRTSSG